MPAGIYTATITDAEGITYVASTEITQPDEIQIDEVINERISAFRARDGHLKASVKGGTEPYTLRWNNGKRGVLEQTNLPFGDYTLTVIDANYCEMDKTFLIDRPKVLPQLDISKIEVGQTLRIEELYFDADSSVVKEESITVMDEIYEFLKSNSSVIIEIGGHTNNKPPHEYCDRLSTARARNVAEYLYDKGIAQDQIIYKGYGKRKPIASNLSKQGQQRNQRVELKILSILKD
jgi:outer membrane protein OmpA-like peptidoglycan-associated protein